MKKNVLLFTICILIGQLFLTSCNNKKEIEMIIDIKSITGKSLSEVEQVLGKSESQEKVTGYPCKDAECTREYFQDGKYEVLFKEGVADRITIYKTPDLSESENAITALGLPDSEPSFANPKTVMRWEGVADLHEVAFFTDYVLVQVNSPE